MTAYIIRRVLLMIPTLFGIMLVSSSWSSSRRAGRSNGDRASSRAPTPARPRASGSAGGDFGARGQIADLRRRRRDFEISRRAGARSGIHQEPGKAVRLRQAGAGALPPDAVELLRFDFGKSYFRDVSVLQLIKEKLPVSMSLGIWMTLAHLSDLDPARHPQGGRGRLAVRHLDLGGDHRRLRDSGIPVRDPADHPVRRRLVLRHVPAARSGLGRMVGSFPGTARSSTISGTDAADRVDGAGGVRHHDAADQELVPRRDPQAICAHRARQGLQRATRCCTATFSATPC